MRYNSLLLFLLYLLLIVSSISLALGIANEYRYQKFRQGYKELQDEIMDQVRILRHST